MSYDPDLRRDTPLARKLIARIRAQGPITLKQYMTACLQDAEYGYYRSRQAVGREGDFVTAPEISQVFGELIGLWCAVVWQQMGSPRIVNLIELGPGRGTLMRDALRAARLLPDFTSAVAVHLVETSEALREVQARTLAAEDVLAVWHTQLEEVPRGPAILIANEFLDALAADQLVRGPSGWHVRALALDADQRLQFDDLAIPFEADVPRFAETAPLGSILTVADFAGVAAQLDARARNDPLAALFIDYGHTASAIGDTLQAVRGHRYEHPLTSPGEADLTTQVDFEDLSTRIVACSSLAVDGPVTQAEFLGRLGIVERASRLMAANPVKAGSIEAGIARLLAPQGMGTRFKVLGVRSAGQPTLPGLEAP